MRPARLSSFALALAALLSVACDGETCRDGDAWCEGPDGIYCDSGKPVVFLACARPAERQGWTCGNLPGTATASCCACLPPE